MTHFRIGPVPPASDPVVLDALLRSSTSTLGHLTDFGFVRGLVPIGRVRPFVGPALTIRIPHADSTAVQHALAMVRPGDVIVIDQSGDDDRSSFGGTLAAIALDAGAIAAVSTGRTNDVREILDLGFPIFSRGTTSLTTRLLGLEGRINVPVAVGGQVVMPGDIVFGDEDGVCVIPRADAAELAERMRSMDDATSSMALRTTVRSGTPLGEITGAASLFTSVVA